MLETLGAVASAIFIIGLIVFGISMAAYIFSGDYEMDERIDYWGK